ncbi:MAG: DNA replication/repair protein RecF [Fimbriimonadaceae bacterium]|nr:DNA replication/repair protein RecF [Fimbriimonadaceae bacterium]
MLTRSDYKKDGDIRPPPRLAGLERISVSGFRNYAHLSVELSPEFNIVVGPNAQGKTNLLEAIYLAATGRILRGSKDVEAIREGDEKFHVSVKLLETGTEIAVRLERGSRKRASLNGADLPRASDILGRMPCVCISSADLPLVHGEPSERRMFLDLELSQLFPSYLRHLSLYKRALEQRNALLKLAQERPQPPDTFAVWEQHLAEHGSSIRRIRSDYLTQLEPHASATHAFLGQQEVLQLVYRPKDEAQDSEAFAVALSGNRGHEIARGTTTIGPHRDDFEILIGGREGRLFGSQGQQRTAVIALKLGTLLHTQSELGFTPILLLDDVLSDLDAGRRSRLVEWVLEHAGQTVLTCTEAEAAGESILSRTRIFDVVDGTVNPR